MDKIAAEAAQEIADMVARWEGGGTRVDPSSFMPIIQSALSQSLAARDKEIEELTKQRDRLSREVNDLRYELRECQRIGSGT